MKVKKSETALEEIRRLMREKILSEKRELQSVIKTVRSLLKKDVKVFVRINGGSPSTYEDLREVLLLEFNSKRKNITVFDGKNIRVFSLLATGDARIREIEEIDQEYICANLNGVRSDLKNAKKKMMDFANQI